MKVIDLFNKIVNGEEVPLKVKWDCDIWEFEERYNDYWNEKEGYLFFSGFDNFRNVKELLNEKVEIIEEEKEIKKIPIPEIELKENERILKAEIKINELIDAVNELKREK